jgi:hypothetical protein
MSFGEVGVNAAVVEKRSWVPRHTSTWTEGRLSRIFIPFCRIAVLRSPRHLNLFDRRT